MKESDFWKLEEGDRDGRSCMIPHDNYMFTWSSEQFKYHYTYYWR